MRFKVILKYGSIEINFNSKIDLYRFLINAGRKDDVLSIEVAK
jgi:hypothetical protein